MLPFQVGRQEADDAMIRRVAVKLPEARPETFFIQFNVFYIMPAVDAAGSAAAFKIKARLKAGGNGHRFKKADGQEWDLPVMRDLCNIGFQRITEAAIHNIVVVLKAEQFQRDVVEALCRGSENPVFKVIIFNGVFQYLFAKFEIQYTKMRYTLLIAIAALFFIGCSKDNPAPEIRFKSFDPNTYYRSMPLSNPQMTLELKDGDGDLGDSSFLYILNLRTTDFDSIALPDLGVAAVKNFKGDVLVNMQQYIRFINPVDTLVFELYLKDNARIKSNVVRTGPLYIAN